MVKIIKETKPLSFGDLIKYKLNIWLKFIK
jgi:hypothetical protein